VLGRVLRKTGIDAIAGAWICELFRQQACRCRARPGKSVICSSAIAPASITSCLQALHDYMLPGGSRSRGFLACIARYNFGVVPYEENTFCFNNRLLSGKPTWERSFLLACERDQDRLGPD
jgi:hypothetical protein